MSGGTRSRSSPQRSNGKTSGRNGNVATVTVTVNGLDPTLDANMVTLVSTDPADKGVSHDCRC